MKLRLDLNKLKAILACLSMAALCACGGSGSDTSGPASGEASPDAPDSIAADAAPDTVAGSAGGLPPPSFLDSEPVAPPDVITEPVPLSEADAAAAAAMQEAANAAPPTEKAAALSWVHCANEGGRCNFSGTRAVQYGADSRTVTKTFTGGVACTNAVFGDPAYGTPKKCSYASESTATPAPAPSPAPAVGGGTPTPSSIAGKRVVGRIDAGSGQVIENVHVVNPNGPCIVVFQGRTNVTIRNSEIGPCGQQGVLILPGANNIRVERNVIHGVPTAVHAYQAAHPIVVDRNFVYNIRGPFPAGTVVTLHTVTSGSGRSKVTCNVSDRSYGSGTRNYTDHISMYKSSGTSANPIEIAYNRIRGGTYKSGSGMMLGDGGGGHIWAHHNTVVHAANAGIGVAGGSNMVIENNRIDNRGADAASLTHYALSVRNFSSCSNITVRGNRGIARLWTWGGTGETVSGYGTDNRCSNVGLSGNTFGDTSLSSSMFDEPYDACR